MDHRDGTVLAVVVLVAAPVLVVVVPVETAQPPVLLRPNRSTAQGIARQVTMNRRRQKALVRVVVVLVVDAVVDVAVVVLFVLVVAAPGPRPDTGPVGLDRRIRNYRL